MTEPAKVRVLFLTSFFEDGGGERLWVNLLNALNRERFQPSALWFSCTQSHFLDELPHDLPIYDLHRQRRFRYELPRLLWETTRVLRKERPDVVLSFLNEWNVITFMTRVLSGRSFRIVTCELGSVSGSLPVREIPGWQKRLVSTLYRRLYCRADAIVSTSQGVGDDLVQRFSAPASRLSTIYSPVDLEAIRRLADEPVDHPWFDGSTPMIVTVGRLIEHKDHPTLLRAFSIIRQHMDVKLVLIGDGLQRPSLEKLIATLNLGDHVALLGTQANPFKYMARASLFALSSVSEGFAYVIVEALALGIPVVSTDCPSGPAELLEGGRDGLLVPPGDSSALAEAALKILQDPGLQRQLARKGRERAGRFSVHTIVKEFERVIAV